MPTWGTCAACGELVHIAPRYDESSRVTLVVDGRRYQDRRERWFPLSHNDGAGLPCVVGMRTQV
jgi:hypothetical protein